MESIHNESDRIVKFPLSRAEDPEKGFEMALAEAEASSTREDAAEQVAPSESGRWVQKLVEMDEEDALDKARVLADEPTWPSDEALDFTAERILAHEEF